MKQNHVKRALRAGGVALGTMVFEFNTTGIARLAAAAGADFAVFDLEHTGWSMETVRMLAATSRGTDLLPFVRLPATEYHFLARALDAGAMGLMVPMVESEAQARLIVASAKYPPAGRRGAAFGVAHDDYTAGDPLVKMASANAETLLIAQIETAAGVENVERIAAVEGIDVLWIGHNDLSNSLSIPGQFAHPRYLAAVERVLAACRQFGKAPGFMVASVAEGKERLAQGFRCLAYWGDIWLYREALAAGIRSLREHP
jgi:2-dehydro-3-deoxyglucarate aldolase/4-hydroxy-2-oxoheptanedioate aldolase